MVDRILPSGNPVADSIYEIERLVACSPTWQGLVGTTDWTVARDAIEFVEDAINGVEFPAPCCVLTVNQGVRYEQVSGGTANFLRPMGDVWIYIAAKVPDDLQLIAGSDDPGQSSIRKAQLQYFANLFGDFVSDLVGLVGTDQTFDADHPASHPSIPTIQLMDFTRSPEDTWVGIGQFWYAIVSLQWGDAG